MDILLDTHVFMWFMNGDKSLSEAHRKAITNIENKCYFSIASIWEIAIKHSIHKLELASGFDKIQEFMLDNDIELLPISFEHIQQLLSLELHHRDPFDRIIIAQGLTEGLIILTRDNNFGKYKVPMLGE